MGIVCQANVGQCDFEATGLVFGQAVDAAMCVCQRQVFDGRVRQIQQLLYQRQLILTLQLESTGQPAPVLRFCAPGRDQA